MRHVKREVIYQFEYLWLENNEAPAIHLMRQLQRHHFFRSETFKLIYDLLFYTSHFLIIWGPARRLLLYKNTSWHCAKRMKENEMEKGSPTTQVKYFKFGRKFPAPYHIFFRNGTHTSNKYVNFDPCWWSWKYKE